MHLPVNDKPATIGDKDTLSITELLAGLKVEFLNFMGGGR
jgi:hypothetical protein